MTPSEVLRSSPKSLLFGRLVAPPAIVVFACSLGLGLGIVMWRDKTNLARDFIGVLLFSDLLGLLAHLLRNRQQLQAALSEAEQRLTREKVDSQARLDAAVRSAEESTQGIQLRLNAAESRTSELQAQLDAQTRSAEEAAQAGQGRLAETNAALKQAEQTIAELQNRLLAATRTEKETTAAAQARSKKAEETVAALKTRLESAERAAQEAAQAYEVELQKLNKANHQLKERLTQAEESEARVAELTLLLEKVESKSGHEAEALPIAPSTPTSPAASEKGSNAKSEEEPPSVESSARTGTRTATATTVTNRTATTEPNEASSSEPVSPSTITSTAKYSAPTLLTEPPEPPAPGKTAKTPRRKKEQSNNQIDLFESRSAPDKSQPVSTNRLKPEPPSKPEEPAPARRLPPTPPLDLPELRKAVNEIVPLLGDQDPGAVDCLKANRIAFRSAFSPEGFAEFEQLVKASQFTEALEHLRKAARKHGISA